MTLSLLIPTIPEDIFDLYEVHNYRNAAQILASSCPNEFADIIEMLRNFKLTLSDIRKPGGNESDIPKKISGLLRHKGWKETRIQGDLIITKISNTAKINRDIIKENFDFIKMSECNSHDIEYITRKNFLDGHKIDYVKERVAFDLEWNSKDQTFDRDLYAFRAFHDCNLIDTAIILTRSQLLNRVFDKLGAETHIDGTPRSNRDGKPKLIKTKYGASTTWLGKLLYRLEAGRNGGCPVLALGITPNVISDWKDYD